MARRSWRWGLAAAGLAVLIGLGGCVTPQRSPDLLAPIEAQGKPYQKFFRTLEQALFLQGHLVE